jgi:outer membrane protein OmpA-like peptidoglycan-associated protein
MRWATQRKGLEISVEYEFGMQRAPCGPMKATHIRQAIKILLAAAVIHAVPVEAQEQPETAVVFHVDVVSRSTKAINYHHRQGSTLVGLEGTDLAPKAKGEVKVDSKTGATKVDAYVEKMPPASSLGEGYLTYVLWAITPEGRPENMGEVFLEGDHARLQAATELQSFGMIVTAEPYYAVTQPSDYVVMEGVVKDSTTGTIMPIDTKYELVSRGGYFQQLPPADRVRLWEAKNKIPLDLMEARQAMAIARAAGAQNYAAETMRKADIDMGNAEAMFQSGQDKKKVQTLARHVTQLSEDARLISVRRTTEDQLARERAESERKATELTRTAESEMERRRIAEREAANRTQEANQARSQAEEARRQTEMAKAQSAVALAEKDRQLAIEMDRTRAAATEAEARRIQSERDRQDAVAKQQMLEGEAARAKEMASVAEQRQRQLEDQARLAKESAERAEADRIKMRSELTRQLNVVLATRETARGLIVNMSDVLFDTGSSTLRPGAREKLAKIAGIILVHPGLKIEVEGHTDAVGGPVINGPLSEKRADSVRTFLVAQGVAADMITARGFGDSKPVADNRTATGRQANRRVELVVSGPLLNNPEVTTEVR